MKENYFIRLPKYNKGYSNEEMFLLALVQALETRLGYASLTFGDLISYCGVTKGNQQLIVEALMSLEKKKHLKVNFKGKTKNSNVVITEIEPQLDGEKSHIQIYLWELKIFLEKVSNSKVISMFNHFAFVIGFINRKENIRQIAYPTLNLICEAIGKTERTVRNYNEELEQLQLLYSNNLVIGKEIVKKVYSRYKDKADVDEAIQEALKNNKKTVSKNKSENSVYKKSKDNASKVDAPQSKSGDIEPIKIRLERYGLDFNKTLLNKIEEVMAKFSKSDISASNIVCSFIEDVFTESGGNLSNKNGFIMNKLKQDELIKGTEERLIKQKKFAAPAKPYEDKDIDYLADYAETQRRIKAKKPKVVVSEESQKVLDSIFQPEPELEMFGNSEWDC